MVQKPLDQSECRILWSTISRKRVDLWSRIFVNKGTQSTEYDQERLGMAEGMPNSESALS